MHLEIYVHVYQDLDFRKKLNDVLFFSFFLKESYFFYSKVWKQLHIQINVIFQSHSMFISIKVLGRCLKWNIMTQALILCSSSLSESGL